MLNDDCYLTPLFSASTMRLLAAECLLGGQNSERYNSILNYLPKPTRLATRSSSATACLYALCSTRHYIL